MDLTDGDGAECGVEFEIGIIPETRTATTLGAAAVGTVVNLEVDVMAKYAERLLTVGTKGGNPGNRETA